MRLAPAYFNVPPDGDFAPPPPPFLHAPLVDGNHNCQWPEGELTCRLLAAPGGRLEPMAVFTPRRRSAVAMHCVAL